LRSVVIQQYELIPITDAAEQAALEARISRAMGAVDTNRVGGNATGRAMATATQVSQLVQQLPAEERFHTLSELVLELSREQQLALVARLRRCLS
jgi:hypothetical protein